MTFRHVKRCSESEVPSMPQHLKWTKAQPTLTEQAAAAAVKMAPTGGLQPLEPGICNRAARSCHLLASAPTSLSAVASLRIPRGCDRLGIMLSSKACNTVSLKGCSYTSTCHQLLLYCAGTGPTAMHCDAERSKGVRQALRSTTIVCSRRIGGTYSGVVCFHDRRSPTKLCQERGVWNGGGDLVRKRCFGFTVFAQGMHQLLQLVQPALEGNKCAV